MNHPRLIFVGLALALALLATVALAQKPPAPTPGPPPTPGPTPPSATGAPSASTPLNSQPIQPEDKDVVMFLLGRVATNDGSSLPNDVLVERVCNGGVRQQVYAAPGGSFNMQLGSKVDSFVDATADPALQRGVFSDNSGTGGIPRRELANCELRASAAGFRSNSIALVDLAPYDRSVDVGALVVQRTTKVKDTTLSALPYEAPPNAQKAYQKGLQAERKGKLADAHKYFEQAVQIYPKYASAWFRLGTVCEKENQKDSALAAYTQATKIDTKFLPPYLSLASMAYKAQDWSQVLQLTRHIIDLDPLNYGGTTGYVVDLDEFSPAAAYFYNAVANYKLNNIDAAEKSALKAEHVDLRANSPELHLLLAQIFTQKKNYAGAISQLQTYLELVPHSKDGDLVREQLAKLEELNRSTPAAEKPVQN